MQGQALVDLVTPVQVFANRVDDQANQIAVLVQEQGESKVTNLLFGVLGRRNEVDGFHVADIDLVTENVGEDDFAEVLLLLVAIEVAI